jgi:hypothetical protein
MVGADYSKRDQRARGAKPSANHYCRKLMHQHGNPNRQLTQTFRCNAALQISAGSRENLERGHLAKPQEACYI